MLAVPSPRLGRGTYIDENALQPGQVCSSSYRLLLQEFMNMLQVNTYWSWGDVHNADLYLAQLEGLRDANSTSEQ
jgi:glycosylphosphatidylinositol transamidase